MQNKGGGGIQNFSKLMYKRKKQKYKTDTESPHNFFTKINLTGPKKTPKCLYHKEE